MQIDYKVNCQVSVDDFITLLKESGLSERRPVDDIDCLTGMLANSNLMVTAWYDTKLVGIARCMTDFNYACYLSDLAVSKAFQKQGIGKSLQDVVQSMLNEKCKLILLAAPDANQYYQQLGYENNPRAWVLSPTH